jgi:hypothetical protein
VCGGHEEAAGLDIFISLREWTGRSHVASGAKQQVEIMLL